MAESFETHNPIPIEAQLCRQYSVSRSVLREAVKMLTAKGLLGSRPRLGTWVQPEKDWNLLDPDVLGWLLERKFSPALLIEFTELRISIRTTNRYKGVKFASVAAPASSASTNANR
jgi:DNA-binding FadR family transcriptional regulator